jgi:hypothetical protein
LHARLLLSFITDETSSQDSLSNALSTNSTFYDGSELSQRSLTLPRRHNHKRNLSSESTFLISSRDCSPIRRRSPAICYSGSLPRSTHSIPGRSPKRTPLSKQVVESENCHRTKSGEIYNKSTLCTTNDSQTQRFQPSRSNYSGPSSFESGKTSSLVTSGPSSIDSGNKSLSLSRNSGHSSLDGSSHSSASTVAQSQSNHLLNSPKNSPKHRLIKSAKSSQKVTTSTSANGIKSTSFDEPGGESGGMPHSNSNGSITLQVTNNAHGCSNLPNTKIFVQNSPIHTSITFENGKLMENSNVFVINNESTVNAKGEIIASRKSIMNSSPATSPLKTQSQQQQAKRPQAERPQRSCSSGDASSTAPLVRENCFSENDDETGDSLSMISETSPDSSLIPYADDDVIDYVDSRRQHSTVQSPETHRFMRNNIECDKIEMNNSRKLSLQIGSATSATTVPLDHSSSCRGGGGGGANTMIYNNMLKNHYNQQTNLSPVYQHNKMNLFAAYENGQSPQLHASVGNLKDNKQINSDCDLKNSLLNSNPTVNSDSLLNIFHKNIIAVGSEPNLIAMKQSKINNCVKDEKTPTLDSNGLYNFPSLTDLSFNFTSLHAQKILKGGLSVNNSIDTLVELDINKANKSNSNISPSSTICTDFGMV